MSEHGDAYRGARARLTALADELDDAALHRTVPTCPDWRVKDVYGHLIGLVADVAARNTAAAGTDEWTAAQVDARRDKTRDELVSEWDLTGPGREELLDKLPPKSAEGIVGDIATHEADINGAVGRTDARDSDAVSLAFARYVGSLGDRITKAGHAALQVNDLVAGDGAPAATVRASEFDLFRALTGRRSPDQVRAFDWTGDPEPYVAIFSAYGVPEAPVIE
jgi:uncharacterized protein (TIGR03083 family)